MRCADSIVSRAIVVAWVSSRTVPLRSLRVRGSWASASVWVCSRPSSSLSPGMRGIPSPRKGSTSATVRDRGGARNRWPRGPAAWGLDRRTGACPRPTAQPAQPVGSSPVATNRSATSRTLVLVSIDTRVSAWKAWSAVSLNRSMRMPLAWSMTARESSAVCRCSARSTARLVEVHVRHRDDGVRGEPGQQVPGPRVGRGELRGRRRSARRTPAPARAAGRTARCRTRLGRDRGELGPLGRVRVSGELPGRAGRGRRQAGARPSRYWVSSRSRARPPLAAAVVGRPPRDDGHRDDRLAGEHPGGQVGHPLEDGLEGVLGEGQASEFVEGRLDARRRRRGTSRTGLRESGTGRTRAGRRGRAPWSTGSRPVGT